MRYFALLSLVCVFVCTAWTQQLDNGIYLHNSTNYPANLSNNRSREAVEWPTNNCKDGECFAIVQLTAIPTDEQKIILLQQGITLHTYIPNRAYLASKLSEDELILPDFVIGVLALESANKRPSTPISLSTGSEGEYDYHLVGLPFPGVSTIELAAALTEIGAVISSLTPKQVSYRITANVLPEVLSCPLLQYTEAAPRVPIPEGKIGRSNLRLRGVNQGPGMGYDGKGIAIAIADDGRISHLDFYGRLIDHTQFDTGTHAEMTTGMAAGAGNIDQSAEGAAPGATIHLFDIGNYEHITNAVSNYNNYGIVITSTSYGEGCGDDYNLATQTIDEQVYNNPQLLHGFSAGNHGLDPCFNPYSWLGANDMGAYYATITGGRKAGKNVLAIGNNEWNDQILASSSRGPTYDGRIKPDLCALGQSDYTTGVQNSYRESSGTSAAAPNVMGALACLYHYFKESHNGQLPSSALIKAMALNTADDQGPVGPDFTYGWGRLNAGKALRDLQQQQYFEGQISHGQQQSFQFAVPSGALSLKVMLYWVDPAGSVLSSRALVNDLDLSLRQPSWDVLLPWIPNSHPHLDSLAQPAQPGKDRLNNVEQVVVNEPASGYYNILVDGYQVPQGAQSYVVVYQIETIPIRVTYPQDGATFVPAEQTLITWDAVGNEGVFSIDYSLDNGQNWTQLANNIPGSRRSYLWTAPVLSNAKFKVRIKRGNQQAISEGAAVIAPRPIFDIQYLNTNQAEINWNSIDGATGYAIYVLGEKHMELVDTSPGLSYLLPANEGQEYWVSVAPIFGDKIGGRANARIYQHYGCDRYVTLDIQFDQYPGETSWFILDQSGSILESSGSYSAQTPNSFISLNLCLPPGCFTLVMTDAYNDGLCCTNGNGYFRLSSINGNVLIEGSEFGGFTYDLFCPEDGMNEPLEINTEVIQQISCFGQQDGAARVIANGGTGNYAYQWSNGSQGTTAQYLGPGFYQVTVTDGEVSQVQNIQIIAPSPINIQYSTQDAICGNGIIDLAVTGGIPPYVYTWSDGGLGNYRQGLASGSYFVVLADSKGCTQSANINVSGGDDLQIQLFGNDPSCSNSNDGSITTMITGGQGNYQLQWSTGHQNLSNITGLNAGEYTLTVTSGNCQVEQTLTLIQPAGFSILSNKLEPSCNGMDNGAISINVSGAAAPYQYQWGTGQNTTNINNLTAGIYLLTLTDINGCNAIRGFQLNEPDALQVQANIVAAQATIGGSVSLSVTGGTAPYIAQWSNGAQGIGLSNLAPNDYTTTVIDANGCNVSTLINIAEPDLTPVELNYCHIAGASTSYEWIDAITVNGNNYWSGNDYGYGEYLDIQIPMDKNIPQTIELSPGYNATSYNEFWMIWIDYNQDGDFDDANEMVAGDGPITGTSVLTFQVPDIALPGQTRMRIAMQYSQLSEPCDNLSYGEVEDYTISLEATQNLIGNFGIPNSMGESMAKNDIQWKVYPNPVVNNAIIEADLQTDDIVTIQLKNINGQILSQQIIEHTKGFFQHALNMESYPTGTYSIEVKGQGWNKVLRVVR